MAEPSSDWLNPAPASAADDEVLYVDVDGYEGPLDLLLDLARRQKVDLTQISVLALAEQYLVFIETIRERRIEIAADYLVMAAWLAYLKSRLMVPQAASDEEPSGEMMAALLQFRLKRLEAMRRAAQQLMSRPRLGMAVHARGEAEPIVVHRRNLWEASLYDLLKAYATQRERGLGNEYSPVTRTVWSLQEARDILQRLIGDNIDWVPLDTYLAAYLAEPEARVTAMASTFASSLELVRQGQVELRQTLAFGPLLMRRRKVDGPQDRRRAVMDDPVADRPDATEHFEILERHLRVLEALLFASREPLSPVDMVAYLGDGADVEALLLELQARYAVHGVNLVRRGDKWAFRTAGDLAFLLRREETENRALSRAALETLAIIAYHQPATRAEVEEVRGVATGRGTLDLLMEAGWVRMRGRRRTPGRPVTYGTTEAFLDHFGLESLGDLPGLDELKGAGLLSGRLPPGLQIPLPFDGPLRDDEEPLDPGDLDEDDSDDDAGVT